jgi:hypothetical protein
LIEEIVEPFPVSSAYAITDTAAPVTVVLLYPTFVLAGAPLLAVKAEPPAATARAEKAAAVARIFLLRVIG